LPSLYVWSPDTLAASLQSAFSDALWWGDDFTRVELLRGCSREQPPGLSHRQIKGPF
jgi:hypothetical protein